MDDQTIVVFDKETKEIMACISLSGKETIFTETANGIGYFVGV